MEDTERLQQLVSAQNLITQAKGILEKVNTADRRTMNHRSISAQEKPRYLIQGIWAQDAVIGSLKRIEYALASIIRASA